MNKAIAFEIFDKALLLVESGLNAHNALQQVCADFNVETKVFNDIFAKSILTMSISCGVNFDKELIKECIKNNK